MKPYWILICGLLAALPIAAGLDDAIDTLDYNGRLTIGGRAFSGTGNFKFVLLEKDGTRLWANSDNEAPIEDGIPSGTVTLSVRDGVYRVRLGDPSLGMKTLPRKPGGERQVSQIGIWFDDGTHGWSFLGYSNLPATKGQTAATTTTVYPPPADMAGVLAELRALRMEVADLRQQLTGAKERPAPTTASTAPQPVAKPVAPPPVVMFNEAKRHSLGRPDAPLVLVEFTDYECTFCRRFFEQTFPLLKRDFIDTGKLRFVSRNMPVASHPHAEPAALALLSVAERTNEDYWKMRAWLFANQRDLGPAALSRYADEAGLERATVLAGMGARKHAAEIQEDIAAAQAAGITGTPSFVLGTSDGQIIRGERIIGAKAFQVFDNKIRALLAKVATSASVPEPKP